MIVRCDAVKNSMSLRDSPTGVRGWIVIRGSSQELHVFTVLLIVQDRIT